MSRLLLGSPLHVPPRLMLPTAVRGDAYRLETEFRKAYLFDADFPEAYWFVEFVWASPSRLSSLLLRPLALLLLAALLAVASRPQPKQPDGVPDAGAMPQVAPVRWSARPRWLLALDVLADFLQPPLLVARSPEGVPELEAMPRVVPALGRALRRHFLSR